jgi:hypothetical protein
MNDRELLEAAAKAAGLPWDQWVIDGDDSWNPLTDDGDALRLAVKLLMEIAVFSDRCNTRCLELSGDDWIEEAGDIQSATRRAIVRAAAEIGKEMK